MGNFKDLRVWQESIVLAQEIYQITRTGDFAKDYGLSNQIQRAAVSIASNIAEGDERNTTKEALHYFHIAKGSSAEVITQLIIAYKIGYITDESLHNLEDRAEKIKASLKNLIKARQHKP